MLATPTVVYTRQLDALSAWEKAKLGLDEERLYGKRIPWMMSM